MNVLECNFVIKLKYVELFLDSYIYNSNFRLTNMGLTSLYGSPIKVNGYFSISNNNLKNFRYCPTYINGNFYFTGTSIKTFAWFPKIVIGDIYCGNLHNLKNKDEIEFKIRQKCEVTGHVFP